ncbi:Phosphatidylinositol 3-kinase catalytic subunit type 3 (PI3-kinase type 3) (PI3K type 3) (PtdIns-3-kinase type 3) (Phosphoinositide-3-kinase class 3) [Durusdinium trenchii]|uniref:phosphatidylinositol 3-kinase n=1 Tax=Durusdinium trenchii TaxID=1381693 RepID=A0ABP0IN81_9DINO
MESVPCQNFAYQLSCDVPLDVMVKIRTLDFGKNGSRGNGGEDEDGRDEDEFCVTVQLFCGEYAMHVVLQSTFSATLDENGRRVYWDEWLTPPARYCDLQLDACLVVTVHSAKRGRVGVAVAKLFDDLGRMRRGRVQLRLDERMQFGMSDSMIKESHDPSDDRARIWMVGERYNHEEVPNLDWLDDLARARTREITSAAGRGRGGDKNKFPVLTIEFPYFRFPVVFEESTYYSERMDAIFSLRAKQEEENKARESMSLRGGGLRRSTSGGGAFSSSGTLTERYPWETQLCVVHDAELLQAQGRAMDGKELDNPVEAKYRKLNPRTVRGVVDKRLKPNKAEREVLQELIHSSKKLTLDNQDMLWKFCSSLTTDKKALIKFVMSVDWAAPVEVQQAEELLGEWAEIDIADALRLLGDEPEFRNSVVRAHAIKILDKANDDEILLYLLQLVQALRYDDLVDIDEALAAENEGAASPTASSGGAAAGGDLIAQAAVGGGGPGSAAGGVSSTTQPMSVSSTSASSQQQTGSGQSAADASNKSRWQPGLLARFLIRRAVNSVSLVSFFSWYLHIESFRKQRGVLFKYVQEELLRQLNDTVHGQRMVAEIKQQARFVGRIMDMGKEGRGRAVTRQNYLQRMLKQSDGKYHELCSLGSPVMHPLFPSLRVVAIDPESLRVFSSKTQPIRLDLMAVKHDGGGSAEPNQEQFELGKPTRTPAMFKIGDDLRQDQLVLQLLGVMDKMFKDVNMDLHLTLYRVLPFSVDEGMMEFVDKSFSLAAIQRNYGSISAFFRSKAKAQAAKMDIDTSESTAAQGRRSSGGGGAVAAGSTAATSQAVTSGQGTDRRAPQIPLVQSEGELYDEMVSKFIKSCAGYCMCTYVLCVGDRHLDNIMIRSTGELFHIDFGYILGNDPRSWAVHPIRLTRDMIDTMGGRGSKGFDKFVSHCCQAYRVLRSNSGLILNLLYLMKDSKIDNLFNDLDAVLKIVHERFELDRSDESAEIWLLDKLNKCEDTFMTTLSDALHNANVFLN